MNDQIEQIKNTYQKNTNDFSFTDTIGSFINNREFSKGYDDFKNGNVNERSYIFSALSAIGQEFGERLYSDVIHYVDNVANVDTCKIKALKSMMYFLGIEYKVISNINLFPVELLDLMDILSLNPKFLLYTDKLKPEFINILIDDGIIISSDQNYTIDENKYNSFKKTLYQNLLSSYISYRYSDHENTRVIDTYDFRSQYTDEYTDRQLSAKIFKNVDRLFNVRGIVDKIENGEDSIENYGGNERDLIQDEIKYRNQYASLGNLSSEPTTRYSYYTINRVLEYANFIDNKYYFDNIISSYNDITDYTIEPNYFRLGVQNFKKVIKYDKDGKADLDWSILDKTSDSLVSITNYICKIRENIKLQMRKNYMKGSFNLLQFMINEFLTEYSKNTILNNTDLSDVRDNLGKHQASDVKLKEYYDVTEYYNIDTNTSLSSDNPNNINTRFWEDSEESKINGIEMAFSNKQIADFYLKTLCTTDTFKDEVEVFEFLSSIYNLGANNFYVNPDSIFHCQLNDGTYTTELYPHLVGIYRNMNGLSSYLSDYTYTFPNGTLEEQISDVMEFIYSNISSMYLSDVYTISTDNELSIQNLNDIYNEITSDFDNLINNEKYGVYLNESKNRYCYKNNDSDNILKHEWKEDYEYAFFKDAYLSSIFPNDRPHWQTNEYSKYQEERLNQLVQFSESYISNYPLRSSLSVINQQFDNISARLMENIINGIVEKYNYFDISSDTIDGEMDPAVDFLNTKIEERKKYLNEMLNNVLQSVREDCRTLQTNYTIIKASVDPIQTSTQSSMGETTHYYLRFNSNKESGEVESTELWEKYSSSDGSAPENYIGWLFPQKDSDKKRYYYENEHGSKAVQQSLYDKTNWAGAIQSFCPSDIPYPGTDVKPTEDDDIKTIIDKLLSWMLQVTSISQGKVIYDDDNYEYKIVNFYQKYMNAGYVSQLYICKGNLSSLESTYKKLKNRVENFDTDYGFSDPETFSDDIFIGCQEIIDYLNDCQKEIESVIERDTNIREMHQYIIEISKLSAEYLDIYAGYQEMKLDNEQVLFLSEFNFQIYNKFNKKALRQLSDYIIKKDNANKTSILSDINELFVRYDDLINVFQELADDIADQMYEITYKPKYGYYEDTIKDLIDNILMEIEMRNYRAQKLINQEKVIVDSYMYTDDYSLQGELNIKYKLSSEQINFYDAIDNRISDVNFFEFQEYIKLHDFYLSYTGRNESKFPYFNVKNTTHASYQIHPYLNQFVEESELETKILEAYDNGLIEELEEQNIMNNISSFIGEYGNIINTWSNGAMDYCGYRTRYEKSTNEIEVHNKTIKNPIVDYDGAFYPPAIEDLFSDPSIKYYIEQVSTISSMTEQYDSGEKTFYGKYYSHLGLNKENAKFICEQLIEYHDQISDIITERTQQDKNQVYDIYQYTLDTFTNSYILYKRYNSTNPDFSERKNTTGQLWIRKANNPIAFPAFYGKYGNIKEDSHDLITHLSGNTIFDIDLDDSLQLIALITNLSGELREFVDDYSHGNVVFGKIQYIQDEKTEFSQLGFISEEMDIKGRPKQFTKNFECPIDYKLVGLTKPDVNTIQCVYSLDKNTEYNLYSLDILTKDNIKDFTSEEITGNNTQSKYTKKFSLHVDSNTNFRLIDTDLVMSFDNSSKEYTFATKLRYLLDDIDIGTKNGSRLSSYHLMSQDEYPDETEQLKTTSLDSFVQYIGIFKYNAKDSRQSLKICNLNADASYIPLYPGENGKINTLLTEDEISSEYYNFELLGRSKDIDREIGMINVNADPYFNIDEIRKNYTFGRVYENYDQIFDKTILIRDNQDILLKGGSTKEWTICLSDYNQYTDVDYDNLKVIFYNREIFGNNPYYIGTLQSLKDKDVDCNYMDISKTEDTILLSNPQIKISGTDDYFSKNTGTHMSNHINNIKDIKISFNSITKDVKITFFVENKNIDSFIAENMLQIVFYNPFDNQIFKFYHLFDTFGMVYTDWKSEMVYDHDNIQEHGHYNILSVVKSYEQGIPSEDGSYDILSSRT